MIDTSTPSDDSAGLLHFPDIIETVEDTPVLLTTLLAPELGAVPIDGLTISCINDLSVEAIDSHDLPGIRIGSGTGCGYIVRRPFDAQLLFVPDAGFNGLTFFRYTIADAHGEEATLVATISVRPEPEIEPESALLAFAHGLQKVSLPVGVGAAILGALTIDTANPGSSVDISVYEGEQTSQSHRFDVQNGTLRLTQPLVDDGDDGIIKLSVVAVADDKVIGRCEVEVEIAAGGSDQFQFTETRSPSQDIEDRLFTVVEPFDENEDQCEASESPTQNCAVSEDQPQPGSSVVRPLGTEDDPFGA
jgi:hypothetical protein